MFIKHILQLLLIILAIAIVVAPRHLLVYTSTTYASTTDNGTFVEIKSTEDSTRQITIAQNDEESTVYPWVLDPISIVEHFCEEYGVDPTLAKSIIKCESGDTGKELDRIEPYQRTIPNSSGASTASGYAQFLNGTWEQTMLRMGYPESMDKHHPIVSIQAFIWLLSQDGTTPWRSSKECWSQF